MWNFSQRLKNDRTSSTNVVMVGDYSSGKSTLTGRLLYDAGAFVHAQVSLVRKSDPKGNALLSLSDVVQVWISTVSSWTDRSQRDKMATPKTFREFK